MKIIGISAHSARSGKDTLANCLSLILSERGETVAITSLAAPLKADVSKFVKNSFGIDVFSCSDEEKDLIRPLLVAYGGAKRKQTKGRYWVGLMELELARLEKAGYTCAIIPDIRYGEYSNDELFWLKREKFGKLYFVEKIMADGEILPCPNEDEERNSPILAENADFKIKWPEMSFEDCLAFSRLHPSLTLL